MNPLRSVGGRLALALLVVVAGALAIVYIVVVPSYQRSLVSTRVADMDNELKAIMQLPRPQGGKLDQEWAQNIAYPVANARVVVFRPAANSLVPTADWPSERLSRDVQSDPVALRALHARHSVRGQVRRNE